MRKQPKHVFALLIDCISLPKVPQQVPLVTLKRIIARAAPKSTHTPHERNEKPVRTAQVWQQKKRPR